MPVNTLSSVLSPSSWWTERLLDEPVPVAPNDGKHYTHSTAAITLEWNRVTNATFYVVQVSVRQDFRGATTKSYEVADPVSGATATKELSTGVDFFPGHTFYWRVYPYENVAGTSSGSGPASPVRSFTVRRLVVVFRNPDGGAVDCDDIGLEEIQGPDFMIRGSTSPFRIDWSAASGTVSAQWSITGSTCGAGKVFIRGSSTGDHSVKVTVKDDATAGSFTLEYELTLTVGEAVEICTQEIDIEVMEVPPDTTVFPFRTELYDESGTWYFNVEAGKVFDKNGGNNQDGYAVTGLSAENVETTAGVETSFHVYCEIHFNDSDLIDAATLKTGDYTFWSHSHTADNDLIVCWPIARIYEVDDIWYVEQKHWGDIVTEAGINYNDEDSKTLKDAGANVVQLYCKPSGGEASWRDVTFQIDHGRIVDFSISL